jgi:hypothetical protein
LALPASASALAFLPSPGSPITFAGPDDVVNDTAVADFDGDGKADIASVGDSDSINVLLAESDGNGFAPADGSPFGTDADVSINHNVFARNFGGDSAIDLLVYSRSPRRFDTYLGNGDGTFPASPNFTELIPFGPGPSFGSVYDFGEKAIGDLNGDGFPDIVAGMTDHRITVALGSATGQFTLTPQSPLDVPTNLNDNFDTYVSATIGDYDGDGNNDVALVNDSLDNTGSLSAVYAALGNGTGQLTPQAGGNVLPEQNLPVWSVATIDLNGDVYDDVTYTSPQDDTVRTGIGSATGLASNEANPKWLATGISGSAPYAQTVADLDNDGADEVAVGNRATGSIGVFQTDGNGGLLPDPETFSLPSIGGSNFNANHVETGDFNGDGALDFASDSSNSAQDFQARGINVLLAKGDPGISQVTISLPETAVGGTSAAILFTISNNGAAPLRLDEFSLAGASGQFEVDTDACPMVLAAGEDCDVSVRFKPIAPGAHEASILISFGDGVGVSSVTLSGKTPPDATANPAEGDFGEVVSGYAPGARTIPFTITSSGGSPLELDQPGLTGFDTGYFSIVDPTSCDAPIPAGQTCTLEIRFSPGAEASGLLEAELGFGATNDLTPPEILLSGFGRKAEYTVTPATKNFGAARVGTGLSRTSQKFTVATVPGDRLVPFNGASISGPGAKSFSLAEDGCPAVIQPGGSCEVTVTFDPKSGAAGVRKAALVINAFSSDGSGPRRIPLKGTATVPRARLSLKLNFAKKVRAGKTLVVKTTVKNTGTAAARPVSLKTTVPGKLAGKPKTVKLARLAPGRSMTKKIKVKIVRSAKSGKKLKVKVVASAPGAGSQSASRTTKIR